MTRRSSNPIPDNPDGKGISHYINGVDRSEGMHPGIRSKCFMCVVKEIKLREMEMATEWYPDLTKGEE